MSKAKATKSESDARYDVIIYCIETGIVDTVAGKDMRLSSGSFHTAEKRLSTVLPRLNELYDAQIVPTGKYKVGDKFGSVE
jgi:hypothetical protein